MSPLFSRAALVITLAASPAFAAFGFPDWVKFPPQLGLPESSQLIAEELADVEVPGPAGKTTVRGKHWMRWLQYTPAKGEPALGHYNGSEARIAQAFEPVLKGAGWKVQFQNDERTEQALTQQRDGKTYVAVLGVDAPQGQVRFELVEIGGAAQAVKLAPPGKKPETLKDTDDLPYLPPPPGSTRTGQGHADEPLDVSLPGEGAEPRLVGSGTLRRAYQGPSSLSSLEFVQSYRAGLAAAGWTVLYPASANDDGSNGRVIAHYAKDGRDLWASLWFEYGARLSFSVADVGAEDWTGALKKDCRLTLNGVTFDFDKATLKAESTPLLDKVVAALKAVPGAVEVQGHTDNKGTPEYNEKLSSARAQTVRDALVKRGVDAKRLTSKGYGMTVPVASNDTELGRAKNRRVQLVLTGCTPK